MKNRILVGHHEAHGIQILRMKPGKQIWLIYHHADVKEKCSLWGLKNSPSADCTSAMVYGAVFAASVKAISMDPWESVKPVDCTGWRHDSIFPLKSLVQLQGQCHMHKHHHAEKPLIRAVWSNIQLSKIVFVLLWPWFSWYYKHDRWALEKDLLFLPMLYIKMFVFTKSQILSHVLESYLFRHRCICSEQRGTCSVQEHQLVLQLMMAIRLETASTRSTVLALSVQSKAAFNLEVEWSKVM